MIFEYINDKIEMTEEIMGHDLTVREKNAMKTDFIESFKTFADKYGFDVELIFSDIDLLAELDELIEYDEELAVRRANEVLGGE